MNGKYLALGYSAGKKQAQAGTRSVGACLARRENIAIHILHICKLDSAIKLLASCQRTTSFK